MKMKPIGGDMPMMSKPMTGTMPKLGGMGEMCIKKATSMGDKTGSVHASSMGMTGSGKSKV